MGGLHRSKDLVEEPAGAFYDILGFHLIKVALI